MILFPSTTIKALPVNPNMGLNTAFINSQFLVQGHEVCVVSSQAWSLAQPPSKALGLWPLQFNPSMWVGRQKLGKEDMHCH